MAERKGDVVIYPVVVALVEGVKAELTELGLDLPEKFSPYPGATIPHDGCSLGWVSLNTMFPSTDFPQQDGLRNRQWTQLAFELQVGISRCIRDDPGGLEESEYLASFDDQMADQRAMRQAICKVMPKQGRDWALGNYTPEGPEGGQVGGSFSVFVRWIRGGQDHT